jgi:hypothetical protein
LTPELKKQRSQSQDTKPYESPLKLKDSTSSSNYLLHRFNFLNPNRGVHEKIEEKFTD